MKSRNIAWWCCFLPLALIMQLFVPGVDMLIVGLIIMLQERNYKGLLWLLPLLVIVQEGIGSREFGGMVLWYVITVLLFLLGRWLFEVENLLFVFLLSACLGAAHWGLAYLLGSLQNTAFAPQLVLDESIIQALVIPILWRIAYMTRKWIGMYVPAAQ